MVRNILSNIIDHLYQPQQSHEANLKKPLKRYRNKTYALSTNSIYFKNLLQIFNIFFGIKYFKLCFKLCFKICILHSYPSLYLRDVTTSVTLFHIFKASAFTLIINQMLLSPSDLDKRKCFVDVYLTLYLLLYIVYTGRDVV